MNDEAFRLTLTAVFEDAPEGGYTCHFAELPEVFSEGETIDEARVNLFDALHEVMQYHRSESENSTKPNAVREPIRLSAA